MRAVFEEYCLVENSQRSIVEASSVTKQTQHGFAACGKLVYDRQTNLSKDYRKLECRIRIVGNVLNEGKQQTEDLKPMYCFPTTYYIVRRHNGRQYWWSA